MPDTRHLLLNISSDGGQSCFGSASSQVVALLRKVKLRPTRQRVALTKLIFSKGQRHISAERLHGEAILEKVLVSLATIYNTLHQFTEAGLLRAIAIDSTRTYYDTNISHHHHFFDEDRNEMTDIPANMINFDQLPEPPEGMEISEIDVVIRLRRSKG